jgi:hypothetical protein
MIQAIPTLHNGITYRSRTEARWAHFFTISGIPFEYEAEGFDLDGDWYVPDFYINGLFFEVKPIFATEREIRVARKLAKVTGAPVVIAAGNPNKELMTAHFPDGTATPAHLVEEFRSDTGAWIVEYPDGGGWALPLKYGLTNCAAHGDLHPLRPIAGAHQFRTPDDPIPNVGSIADLVIQRLRDEGKFTG